MNTRLYKLMNWPEIEEIIYSDGDDPHRILGAHKVGTNTLIQAFFPGASSVTVKLEKGTKKNFVMELADEAGFFAALVPGSPSKLTYSYEVVYEDGTKKNVRDPYNFAPVITREDCIKFTSGIHYDIYDKLGAHIMTRDGVSGVNFATWAPDVARVSVIGDFNGFDGRLHQMRRVDPCGIFEIFIPDVEEGAQYRFEIKTKDGFLYVKADPYARKFLQDDENVCVVTRDKRFKFTDDKFIEARKRANKLTIPLSIAEISLDSFASDMGDDVDYEQLAAEVVRFVKTNGFNAIELTPVMETDVYDPFGVLAYFAPDSMYGDTDGFQNFVDIMHAEGIRVIMDFVCTFFPENNPALRQFTGTHLYEYGDPNKGVQKSSGYIIFDYGRKEVTNYLISCALYWVKTFHLDGLRFTDISKALYLDYDRAPGEWMPNIYGGNQNLEAEEFVRHLNSVLMKHDSGILRITKETACYPQVTGPLDDGGLGFDLKWNNGWSRDFFTYMKNDPLFRSSHHNELTFSLIYHYSEHFILTFSHEDIGGYTPMTEMMPGDISGKEANARFAIAYLYLHPGRKMIYRGIWEVDGEKRKKLGDFMKALNTLYFSHPALYETDDSPEGFEWINSTAAQECNMSFLRKGKKDSDTLLIVCNMAGVRREMEAGVPFDGKYTEILNTDEERFGGSGAVNGPTPKEAINSPRDGRQFMIPVTLAPASIVVFKYTPYTEEEKKIRVIRHEARAKMEEEQSKKMKALAQKREKEEAKLLKELRKRYEKEISEQEKAIAEKYRKIEEEKIGAIIDNLSDMK